MCVCVCVCARARVCVRVCVCVCINDLLHGLLLMQANVTIQLRRIYPCAFPLRTVCACTTAAAAAAARARTHVLVFRTPILRSGNWHGDSGDSGC